jgi:hypothetical protein
MALSLPYGILPITKQDIEDVFYGAFPSDTITTDAVNLVYNVLLNTANQPYFQQLRDVELARSRLLATAINLLNDADMIATNGIVGEAEVRNVLDYTQQ